MSDTPRTDALVAPNGCIAANLLEHTRGLERELNQSNTQRDEAIAIADGVMNWETMQDTRNSMKDLAKLKKEIKESQ